MLLKAARVPEHRRELAIVIALTALGAGLRFAWLGTQSFWYDESLTVELARASAHGMLHGVRAHEATPPLYFAAAWVWAQAFGTGEAALRSLSAVAGVLTVPVAYALGREIGGRGVATAVGALTATSPALIWYSQEARSYALLILLCGVSVLFCVRALRGTRAELMAWALASALAIVTHYFAIFLVVAEAAWLIWRHPRRREAVVASALPAVVLAALAPLLLYQSDHGGTQWIEGSPLIDRIANAFVFFAVGPGFESRMSETGVGSLPGTQLGIAAVVWAILLAGIAVALRRHPRRVALVLAAAAALLVLPLAVDLAGRDVFLDRNVLPAWLPIIVVAVAGLVGSLPARVSAGIVAILCVAWVVSVGLVPNTSGMQRDDWRAVAAEMPSGGGVLQVVPGWDVKPLSVYTPVGPPLIVPARVSEVAVITYDGYLPGGDAVAAPPGPPFREAGRTTVQRMTITRYAAPRPEPVAPPRIPGANGPLSFLRAVR